MQGGEIGKHSGPFNRRFLQGGLLGSIPSLAVLKIIFMKYKITEPAKSFNGISVYLLRGALRDYYTKDWTPEQIKEYEDWVSTNTQAYIFVKENVKCVDSLTKQWQNG